MKKILLASVITALALPVIASETTTITTSSPKAMATSTTTTTTVQEQKMEEAPAEVPAPAAAIEQPSTEQPATGRSERGYSGQSRAPDTNATLPRTGGGTFNQQRMEDPTIEDESDEYVPKIDDVDDSEDYE